MPIKFYCHSCGKKVSVPDGVASRQGWCPHCKVRLIVPDAGAPPLPPSVQLPENSLTDYADLLLDLDQAEAANLARPRLDAGFSPAPPPAPLSADETLDLNTIPLTAVPSAPPVVKFNCPRCGQKIGASPDLVGQSGVCPRCGGIVTAHPVPPSPDMTAPMIRPPSRTPTQYGFKALTDAERRRIEEEERVRALARVHAEEEARRLAPVSKAPPAMSLAPGTGRLSRMGAFLRRRPVWSSHAGASLQAGAALKSYVGASVIVFLLYCILCWPVALVFNWMWLSEAERMERVSGIAPAGKGCLQFMLWFCILSVTMSVVLVLALLGQLPSAKQHRPSGTPQSPRPEPSRAEDDDALLKEGNERYLQGDRRGAIADYDAALRINPRDTDALMNRGNARAELGDLAGALSDWDAALQISPRDAGAFFDRGLVDRDKMDNLPGAIANFTEAVKIDPHLSKAYAERGLVRFRQSDFVGAIADYNAALEIDPQDARTLANRGDAHDLQGDFAGAIADYRLALQVAPPDWSFRARVKGLLAKAYVDRGLALFKQGDTEGAIADYETALKMEPQNPRTLANRGDARCRRGDLAGAIADYRLALQVAPPDWEPRENVQGSLAKAYVDRGLALYKQGDLVGAIADYDAALKIDPENPRTLANRGDAHGLQGDLDDAIDDYSRALQVAPPDWELRQKVEEKRDRAEEQRRKQREAKKKHEGEARHLLNWARSYVKTDPQKAFDFYSRLHNEYADTDAAKEGESEFEALKQRLNK